MPTLPQQFLLMFAPDQWSAARRFGNFVGPPFEVTPRILNGTGACSEHLEKFSLLATIADRTVPRLADDEAELEREGVTHATASRELAAIFESMYAELYSSLDGIRSLLYSLFKLQGIPEKSNEKLFKKAEEQTYGAEFPEAIRIALSLAYATWFPRLRNVRVKTVHGRTGSCHRDGETGRIRYTHHDFGSTKPDFTIEDVVLDLRESHRSVVTLHTTVFDFLYAQLHPKERILPCGVYKEKLYERFVVPEAGLSFASGRCYSLVWFEGASETMCPLAPSCKAYRRAKGVEVEA